MLARRWGRHRSCCPQPPAALSGSTCGGLLVKCRAAEVWAQLCVCSVGKAWKVERASAQSGLLPPDVLCRLEESAVCTGRPWCQAPIQALSGQLPAPLLQRCQGQSPWAGRPAVPSSHDHRGLGGRISVPGLLGRREARRASHGLELPPLSGLGAWPGPCSHHAPSIPLSVCL